MSWDLGEVWRRVLLDAARRVIRDALVSDSAEGLVRDVPAAESDPVLLRPAGCFVSLHDRATHALRGCIGRLEDSGPLIEAVRQTAVGVLSDPRFAASPVTADELPRLEIEISVLSPLRPIDGPEGFDLLNDGIYLIYGSRHGCFLPQVARQTGWTRQQLLTRLCTEKLGLPPFTWRDPRTRFLAFSVTVIGPEPFESGYA